MEDYALSIKGISKKFDNFVMEDINLYLPAGEVVGLIGENGAGKTTLIRLIMNMYGKDAGDIKVYGKDTVEDEEQVKNIIGYVSDNDYLSPYSNLAGYMHIFKEVYDEFDEKLAKEYADKWELPLYKKFSAYSKGMKVKAMILLALSHNPKLLILDEPTAGLDPVARLEFLDIFREFVADGTKTVIFSTHITSDLDKIADRMVLINKGSICENITLDAIYEKYVWVDGDAQAYEEYAPKMIFAKKVEMSFSGLALRSNIPDDTRLTLTQPNMEKIMVGYIMGNR